MFYTHYIKKLRAKGKVSLTSALLGGGQLQAPAALPPRKELPGTHWIGGWVGSRVGLDDVEKRKILTLPGFELRPLGLPARSQSLYRLSYPSPSSYVIMITGNVMQVMN
jgi:hypothetical protein